MACLAAAGHQAARAGRAVRRCEAELCAVFGMTSGSDSVVDLAEHMSMMVGAATKGSREASEMERAFEMAVKMESYNALKRVTTTGSDELMEQVVEMHAEEGGCSQCTDDGEESRKCVHQEIDDGELRDARRDAALKILQSTVDVEKLRRGAGAEIKGIWTEELMECQDGNCSSQNGDAADTAARTGDGQGSGCGGEVDEAHAAESRAEAMKQLEEADAGEVCGWIAQNMTENMGKRILQVVAGKGVTGEQIKQAMSTQSTGGDGGADCEALFELFECRASREEVLTLQVQLQSTRVWMLKRVTDHEVRELFRAKRPTETSFCCPWESKAWNKQCVACKRRREAQWSKYQELMEQMQGYMDNTIRAATVATKEQAFSAVQLEEMMTQSSKRTSAQGAREQLEDEADMFQRQKGEYEVIKRRETATDETEEIIELFNKEVTNKKWFDNSHLGSDFETILKRSKELCYCRETGYVRSRNECCEHWCMPHGAKRKCDEGRKVSPVS